MKAIIPVSGIFNDYSFSSGPMYENAAYSALIDIEKVMSYLDGKVSAEVNLMYVLQSANRMGITKNINCKYFSVTFYKKGTMHIKIHPEFEYIIDSLNIFVCKKRNWLPPHYGEKTYQEMSDEEKKVVDEFQGEKAYERILSDRDLYITSSPTSNLLLTSSQ